MNSKLKTYLVEDNATIRENLVGTLEELACIAVVGFAETEAEARHWLESNGDQWDLAIVDLFLKQGSGLGVLQACLARRPNQRVVVLSNYATPDIRKRCAQLGVDAVFDKSNEIDALIDYCCSRRSQGVDAQSHDQPAAWTRSVDQLVLQRVVGQVAVGGQVHLFHQAGAVGADRLDRQRQRLGDVAGGLALGQLEEHLELALRQLLVRAPRRPCGRAAAPAVRPPPA